MADLLQAEGVRKEFGGLVAVNDVDFTIPERSIVSLIGPNGAGKTTFFNMLTGVYKPTGGLIVFDGHDVTGKPPHAITERGIGNGISFIIFAGIVSRAPGAINAFRVNPNLPLLIGFALVAIAAVGVIIYIQEGQRRIPIQYAKRMVGRRMTAGGSTYMPLRVNMAGVIPIIFAAAILAFPPTIAQYFPQTQDFVNSHFTQGNLSYMLFEGFLIVIFTYFYTAVTFNPVDQADNLRKHGGYIPGIRPGPPTARYLDRVLTRLTLPGSIYLAAVAVLPSLFIKYGGFSQATSRALGGTSVLIVVGVALDTMRQMESQMMMRSYEGFLK